MKVSLIIATYNWKEALGLVLNSVLIQTRLPDEIIIADDGSADGTKALVQKFAGESPVPVLHSWQEDLGFRAARSRNGAIAKAQGAYIVLVDGDMLLDRHFIEDHCAAARTNSFIQGSRVLLGRERSSSLLAHGLQRISLADQGLGNRKNCIRSRLLSRICSKTTENFDGLKTCNFSFYREDAIKVNGFNEDFVGWGREDSEFGIRLMNAGVQRRNLRFQALAYHLYHAEQTRGDLSRNDAILEHTIKQRLAWCENGLNRHDQRSE